MKHVSDMYKGYAFNFSRVNVLLGANGVGKSRFMHEIMRLINQQQGKNKYVYIEGGRTIAVKDYLQLDNSNFQAYASIYNAKITHDNKRKSSLASRVFDALIVLDKKGDEVKAVHSDRVESWIRTGKKGHCPTREQSPLNLLFEMFNEIFPLISITYDAKHKRLKAKKFQDEYSPTLFSDGEKQVFSILADFIDLPDYYEIIIVDEPELNLHPELADRLWTLLENKYSNKLFIYASHNINFAMRDNVNTVYVLSEDPEKIMLIDSFHEIERNELSTFLGGLPGILSTNRVIVTEGNEKSFDSIFYRWLIGDNSIEIYPGGGCNDVISIVRKSGLWDRITTKISLIGIIDSDYKSSNYLSTLKTDFVYSLPYHEAESFLCLPSILSVIGERIGSQEQDISTEIINKLILENLNENKLFIAAKRVFARSNINLRVNLTKQALINMRDPQHLLETLKISSEEEILKAEDSCSIESLNLLLQEELDSIEHALVTSDVNAALIYLPGKELLNKLAPKAGCRNGEDLMRSLRRNFTPNDFSEIKDFKEMIETVI